MFGTVRKYLYSYQKFVESRSNAATSANSTLSYWKNRLFIKFLVFCLPVSLIAVIPGVVISFIDNYKVMGIIDLISFISIGLATLSKTIPLRFKKIIIVTVFYNLAIFLIVNLGYIGPGIFYLLSITILIALFFRVRYAYFSIFSNAVVLIAFAVIIHFQLFNTALNSQYTAMQWLAFGSNLIVLSILLTVLIQNIFNRLQSAIVKKERHKAKYKNIFEYSPTPMWLYDINSLRFLDVNQAAIQHYGYSYEEFLNITIKDIRPEQYRKNIEEIIEGNRYKSNFLENRFVHQKKNGEQIYVKIESSLLDFNGRSAKLVSATDITAQVNNEEKVTRSNIKLQQSESNLRAIFESSIQGFVLLDNENNVITFNSKATDYIKLNNYNTPFKIGQSIYDFVEVARKPFFKDLLKKVSLGETIEYYRKYELDNNVQWVHYILTPVYENEQINGCCITGNDVTAAKQHLETIELQNKKFLEISWIQSHMVRAPLARLMGLAPLIISETDKKERDEMLTYFQISANDLDDIIKEITAKVNKNLPAENKTDASVLNNSVT